MSARMQGSALPWHDEATVLGVRVRAYFFNPADIDARADFLGRQVPILRHRAARLVSPEDQRDTYTVSALLAQPDAVLAYGNGLLCLNYKGGDGRLHEPATWRRHWRCDVMLLCIASAMAVAGQRQQPTAALWRGANVLCQFDPSPAVLECLADEIGRARAYWNEPQWVSAAQLAKFCEPRLRAMSGLETSTDASPA